MGGDSAEFRDLWLAASSPTNDEETAPAAPLAGRKAELTALRRHFETGCGAFLVTGEAGIGKTTLVTTAAATADAMVGVGRCLPLSTEVPLLPVADALRTLLEHDGGSPFEQAVQRCTPYVAASLSRVLPEVGVLAKVPDPDDEWSRQRLFQAVGMVLVELGRHRRAALLIDDVHWADAATLDLLEHVLARNPGVAVVGTWQL